MSVLNLPNAALVCIYCRVSDPAQSGIPSQRKWARRRAAELKLSVVADLEDDGISGDDMGRPGLLTLEETFRRAHKEKRPILCLLIDQADRLSRADSIDTSAMLARLRHYGLRWIITGQRIFDLRDAMDRTLFLIECDHKNNPFLRDLARRSLNGTIEAALAGFWSGRTPLGYKLIRRPGDHPPGKRRKSGRLAEDEVAGPIARELPLRYLAGESTVDLARWLDAQVKSPYSPSWTPQSVAKILHNRIYTGIRLLGKAPSGKHAMIADGAAVVRDQDGADDLPAAGVIRIVNAAPRLWTDEVFEAVQRKLVEGKRRNHRIGLPPLPLASLGECGHCGEPLHCARQGSRSRNYPFLIYCGNRAVHGVSGCRLGSRYTDHNEVLAKVLSTLAENLLDHDAVERLAERARADGEEAQAREEATRGKLNRRLAENLRATEQTRSRLGTAPEDMLEEYHAALRDLKQQRTALETELRQLDQERLQAPLADGGEEQLRTWLELCRKLCSPVARVSLSPDGDDGTLNALLSELISGFTVYWKAPRQGTGRALERVEVELPGWLNRLLATSDSAS
jgi:DNA invertase Pin-like site-specific DNA recombinase